MKNERSNINKFILENKITDITLRFTNNKDYIFSYLKILERVINLCAKENFDNYDFIYYMLDNLNRRLEDDNNENKTEVIKQVRKIKQLAITKIKKLKRLKEKKERKISFLKDIANRLECIEVFYTFSSKEMVLKIEYDFMNYLLFESKNIYHSKQLINKFPYMINVLQEKESILEKLVENYLQSLTLFAQKDDYNYKIDLLYYEQLIFELLSNDIIEIKEEEIKNSLKAIKKTFNDNKYSPLKEKKKITIWLTYLINLLNNKKETKLEENNIENMFKIKKSFSPEIIDEANLFNILSSTKEEKENTTDYIISLDKQNTFLKDDALSIKKLENGNFLLKIYICNPNHYFPKDSLIMHEAYKRGQSIYIGEEVIPMFPFEIQSHISLEENKKRFTRVYEYEIDKYGKIVNQKFFKQIITVNNNLTYEEIDNVIKNGICNGKLYETLSLLTELYNIIKEEHINKIVDISFPNKWSSITSSYDINATYMTFHNHQLAKYFKKRNLPFIYRYHELNNKIKFGYDLDMLSKKDQKSVTEIIRKIESTPMKPYYSKDNCKHDGLDLEAYCHSTTPAREYAAIIANNCCDTFIFGKPTDEIAYNFTLELEQMINYLNFREQEILQYYTRQVRKRSN